MEQGKLEEQITVVALTPIVQAKKTQVTTNVGYEQLQSLPSARDPWVVLQMAPSVFIDRENIGGSESGQQSGMIQGLHDPGVDHGRRPDHGPVLGRLPRVL